MREVSDETGGEAPGLLHSCFFDADDGSDGKELGGYESGLDFPARPLVGTQSWAFFE